MGPRYRPRDFLLIEDRPIRLPLQTWARSIRTCLDKELAREGNDLCQIVSLLNLTALIEASRGNVAGARNICEAELNWLSTVAARATDRGPILALALQPWINLGRLLRLEGRTEQSLRYFSALAQPPAVSPLFLGPCAISAEDWKRLPLSGVADNLPNIYFVESLKSYFWARDFRCALIFIAQLDAAEMRISPRFVREAKIIAHISSGNAEAAYELAKPGQDQDLLGTLVFMLYEASCLAALQQRDRADAILRDLRSFVSHESAQMVTTSAMLRYMADLGALLEDIGQPAEAASVYEKGFRVALAANDQVSQISFLRSKMRLAEQSDVSGLELRLKDLISGCHYEEVLQAEGIVGRQPDAIFGELLATVAGLIGVAAGNFGASKLAEWSQDAPKFTKGAEPIPVAVPHA